MQSASTRANRTPRRHREHHRTSRIGWLRAAVLGANDGIVSTGSLMLGVAATSANHSNNIFGAPKCATARSL